MATNQHHARRNRDGLAIIGRTPYQLRGIRFDEGEEGGESTAQAPEVPDISVYEAAIADRDAQIAALTSTNTDLTAQINAAKAANYDLLVQVGAQQPEVDDTATAAADDLDIDNFLFTERN